MDHLAELKQRKQWVNYILYPRSDGSYSKPPINSYTLKNGSSTDPEQWTDYQTASMKVGKTATFSPKDAPAYVAPVNGTGLVIVGNLCGIDLDHVVKNGKIIAPFAEKLVQEFDTYTELSVSGTGLHLLMYADDLTENISGKYHVDGDGRYKKDGEFVLEVYAYPRRSGGRYLTVTEKVFRDRPMRSGIGSMLRKVRNDYEEMKNERVETQYRSSSVGSLPPEEADEKVLEKAYRSKKGDEIRRLYEGDTSVCNGDHSGADQAFINHLAYWTNGNRLQMDRIFRNSGLMRPKWNQKRGSGTYGSMTIDKALQRFTQWTAGSGFTDEERKEYGRKLHAQMDSERAEALDINNLYLEENGRPAEANTASQQTDIMDPNNHNGNIGENWWTHWEYTRAIIKTKGVETEYRYYESFRKAWRDTKLRDPDCSVDFYMKPSGSTEPAPVPPSPEIKPLSYEDMVRILTDADDDNHIHLKHFEDFSKVAKIGVHDSVVIAGETGSGKSTFALNLIDDLNDEYPCCYFNLEMTEPMVIRRLVSIHTGMKLDSVESYNSDPNMKKSVDDAMMHMSERKPLYVIDDQYKIPDIKTTIETLSRQYKEPLMVFIDHTLLVKMESKSSYERYTGISEELRQVARLNNCIMFILTQQNRAGKNTYEVPELSSLKESGSFENDGTHVVFIWHHKEDSNRGSFDDYYLVLRKNRKGRSERKWILDIEWPTQIIRSTEESLSLDWTGVPKEIPEFKGDSTMKHKRKR